MARIASVTPDQSVRDSLGSCFSRGGRTFGATARGAMSIIVYWASLGWEAYGKVSLVRLEFEGAVRGRRGGTYDWLGT